MNLMNVMVGMIAAMEVTKKTAGHLVTALLKWVHFMNCFVKIHLLINTHLSLNYYFSLNFTSKASSKRYVLGSKVI